MLEWIESKGGSLGMNYILKVDGKFVGHFYIDADEGVDVEKILQTIAKRYNKLEVDEIGEFDV